MKIRQLRRREFLKATGMTLAAPIFATGKNDQAPRNGLAEEGKSPNPDFKSFDDCMRQPWGKLFWIGRKAGRYRIGDPVSHFNTNLDFTHLTFDIGNNKALANVGVQGAIKKTSIYRDSYWCNTRLRGVWTEKDNTCFGPYSYLVQIGSQAYDLAVVDWDFRTGLLDNIFPITELTDPAGRLRIHLLTYAPLSADGSQRIRGVIYGLHLQNISNIALNGSVCLPKLFADDRGSKEEWERNAPVMERFDPSEFELGLGDSTDSFERETSFDLKEGQCVWVPTIIYMPGEPTPREINERGTFEWFLESWRYYPAIIGTIANNGRVLARIF